MSVRTLRIRCLKDLRNKGYQDAIGTLTSEELQILPSFIPLLQDSWIPELTQSDLLYLVRYCQHHLPRSHLTKFTRWNTLKSMGFEPEREIGDHSKYDDWCGKVLYPINLERCWACEVPGITVFVVLISSFELEILWYHDSNCKKCHFKLQLPFPIFRIFNHDVRGLERKLLLTSYQGKTYALSFPSKTKNRLNYILEEVPLDFRDLRLLRGIRGNLSITLSPNLTTLQIYDIRRCGLTILNELDFKSIGSITLIYLLCNSDAKHVLLCDHTGLFWDYIIDGPPPRLLSELNILGPFKQVLFRNPDEDHSTGQVFLQRSNESWVLVKTTDNKLGGDYWGDSPELEIRLLI